ncbi:hypothetical protein Tco_1460020, partial [Tanacetum coccineum]
MKKAQQLEPKLYNGNIIKNTCAIVIPDSEETLTLAEESRSKMLLKQQDPIVLEKKVNTTPVDYANSMNSSDPSPSCRPTKVDVPKELPKFSMVNSTLKKLKHHLVGFNVVVKERTTTTSITEGSWGFDHTKACFRDEIIPFAMEQHRLESKTFEDVNVKKNIDEIETINIELEHRVLNLIAENENLKQTYKQLYDSIKPTRIRSKEQCDALINQVNQKSMEISDLNAKLQEQVDDVVTKHTIDPEMLKIDVEPIAPKLLNNRTAHSYYLKHTQEQAAILREEVEQGRSQNPLNNSLDSA